MTAGDHGLTARQGRARYRRIVWFAARIMVVEWWFELVLPRLGMAGVSARGVRSGCGGSRGGSMGWRWSSAG